MQRHSSTYARYCPLDTSQKIRFTSKAAGVDKKCWLDKQSCHVEKCILLMICIFPINNPVCPVYNNIVHSYNSYDLRNHRRVLCLQVLENSLVTLMSCIFHSTTLLLSSRHNLSSRTPCKKYFLTRIKPRETSRFLAQLSSRPLQWLICTLIWSCINVHALNQTVASYQNLTDQIEHSQLQHLLPGGLPILYVSLNEAGWNINWHRVGSDNVLHRRNETCWYTMSLIGVFTKEYVIGNLLTRNIYHTDGSNFLLNFSCGFQVLCS